MPKKTPVPPPTEKDIFTRRGKPRPEWEDRVVAIAEEAAHRHSRSYSGSMASSTQSDSWEALDGACSHIGGGWGGGERGWYVGGTRLRRYILYRLGAKQPRRKRAEDAVPALEELEAEIIRLREAAERQTRFEEAVQAGDEETVRTLLRSPAGLEMDRIVRGGETPLLSSLSRRLRSPAIAHLLIQAGADVNRQSSRGTLPIHYAVQFGHLEVVKALVEAGANPLWSTPKRESALYLACQAGHADIAGYLLGLGDNPNAECLRNWDDTVTPLLVAASRGDSEIVRLLLHHGADVNYLPGRIYGGGYGHTALVEATRKGHSLVVELLLAHGADPDYAHTRSGVRAQS